MAQATTLSGVAGLNGAGPSPVAVASSASRLSRPCICTDQRQCYMLVVSPMIGLERGYGTDLHQTLFR